MLNDATHTRYASCPHAAGPFPYMSGGMVCMSSRLTSRLASDEHFRNFNAVAHSRNTAGTRCTSPRACAAQPAASHMWHHEDAGVGYNVFRATIAANASTLIVAAPGHFDHPGVIEHHAVGKDGQPKPLDATAEYWSGRALFVHNVKKPEDFATATARWNLTRAAPPLDLRCHAADTLPPGGNPHHGNWGWARVPCPPPARGAGAAEAAALWFPGGRRLSRTASTVAAATVAAATVAAAEAEMRGAVVAVAKVTVPVAAAAAAGDFCDVEPRRHFSFCRFPWEVPPARKANPAEATGLVRRRKGKGGVVVEQSVIFEQSANFED